MESSERDAGSHIVTAELVITHRLSASVLRY